MLDAQEYRKAFEAGYMYGRIDAIQGADYDDRTPLQKRRDSDDVEPDGRTLSTAD